MEEIFSCNIIQIEFHKTAYLFKYIKHISNKNIVRYLYVINLLSDLIINASSPFKLCIILLIFLKRSSIYQNIASSKIVYYNHRHLLISCYRIPLICPLVH